MPLNGDGFPQNPDRDWNVARAIVEAHHDARRAAEIGAPDRKVINAAHRAVHEVRRACVQRVTHG